MEIKAGDILYFENANGVGVCVGTVKNKVKFPRPDKNYLPPEEAKKDEGKEYVVFTDVRHVAFDKKGTEIEIGSLFTEAYAEEECCRKTSEELLALIKKRHDKEVREYAEEIKTPTDLVRFAVTHTLFGEDKDFAAHDAFIVRASQLLDIPLDRLNDV